MAAGSKVKDLTGPGHTDRFGVGGTDLGVTVAAPDGRLVSVFGDTFEQAGVGGPGWRSPVVLFGDPTTVETGIEWTGAAEPGDYAHQVLAYKHGSVIEGRRVTTILPTDVITIGNEMYLHVMVCEGLGSVHWTELHRSIDNGETWEHTGVKWPGGHHGGLFQMLTWEHGDDGYVYVFSTGFQRDKGLILQRVPADRLADPAAWEGWGKHDDQWSWGTPPTVVLTGAHGELCLRRVEGHWLLTFFDAGNYRIDVLSLASPTNLYQAQRETLVHGTSWDGENHAQGRVAQLYGGYIVPGSTLDDLHLIVSQWNTTTNWPYRAMQFHANVADLVALQDQVLRDLVEWLSDTPARDDLLRRRPLAEALATRLHRFQDKEPGTSFLIHIDGAWGTGKSTLLDFVRAELAELDKDWVAVDFDAWRQSRVGPPWWALLAALRGSVGGNRTRLARVRLRVLESWARLRHGGAPLVLALILLLIAASAVFLLLGPGTPTLQIAGDLAKTVTALVTALATLWAGALVAGRFLLWDSAKGARLFEQSNTNPMKDVTDHFGWLVTRAGGPIVFFIDNLDRCTESYVVELLDAIQTLIRDSGKDTRKSHRAAVGAYFVVAADGAWIRKSYEIAYEKFAQSVAEPGRPLGYLFLDKLFQLRVPVPSIGDDRQRDYLRQLLGVRDIRSGSYPLAAEEQAVRERLRRSSTEAEIIETLRQASPQIRERLASSAVKQLTRREVEAATEHSLQRFGPLLPPNPRSTKRFVNFYGTLRTVRTLESNPVRTEPLALWTIIETRWPMLADYLRARPDAIDLVGKPAAELESVPVDLRELFGDPAVSRLTNFEHGGPLTPELIRACCGIEPAVAIQSSSTKSVPE